MAGDAYSASRAKRALDLAISAPLSAAAVPVMGALGVANFVLDPHLSPIFIQRRVGHGNTLPVVKLRSMHPAGPAGRDAGPQIRRFGRFMRRHYLDELPQLPEVVAGRLSMVGIRVLPREIYDALEIAWSPERFQRWSQIYARSPLGLTGVHQVFRGVDKEDRCRFHRDTFYARRASLGLDLYLIWRTFWKAGH
jgi:lipopolysaccharide/colanic/teichoic acid biosynthesis glycosyltransferase